LRISGGEEPVAKSAWRASGSSLVVVRIASVARSYRPVHRDQGLLLPPDMRDWLPEDHLVWLGLEIVEQLDRSALHSRHPNSGPGRAAYDPDKKDGELPCAVIVAETEPPIILDELRKYLSDEGMTEWYLPTRLEYEAGAQRQRQSAQGASPALAGGKALSPTSGGKATST
jgi:hypothetical protein